METLRSVREGSKTNIYKSVFFGLNDTLIAKLLFLKTLYIFKYI